ncbi:hypothetical protein JK361_10080 [Streptomyces sp. 5-8]|uniref:Uncharacterized protein n=1 Tax=Streptomyces musisoli TaxID=2802280 RepID=A0ABS1NXZ3_9ACTN|nr:hypothetical protein [Streptomyces musisoli]MBL1104938.1 hypothetical protein [Streptomyces musisoli]
MAIYERGSGPHVAERVQPEPGGSEEKRLEALAEQGADGWHRVEDAELEPASKDSASKRPAKAAQKTEEKS